MNCQFLQNLSLKISACNRPITISEFAEIIKKRIRFYAESEKVELPVDEGVFYYLYKITRGRLRYVFGLISRLMSRLYVGDLTDKITLDLTNPMLMKLGHDRLQRSDITTAEKQVLRLLVSIPNTTASNIAKKLSKTSQYTGRVLSNLASKGLISSRKEGRDRFYKSTIDAIIAYTDTEV